jgi:hypothetical protein
VEEKMTWGMKTMFWIGLPVRLLFAAVLLAVSPVMQLFRPFDNVFAEGWSIAVAMVKGTLGTL